MQPYYAIPADQFSRHSPIRFRFVETHADLCAVFARDVVDLLRARQAQGRMTVIVLPVGPLDYRPLAELCNREGVSCESLVILSMDEYCDANGKPISPDHPLSFREFYRQSLLERLDRDKQLPPDQLILPDPQNLDRVQQVIEQYGGIDTVYGGMGINGHFAFNTPEPETDLETFRNRGVHLMELGPVDATQMVLTGTGGNWEILPPMAVTLGMKELLSARRIHLTFMRSWHAGVLRRALFGPVTAAFPGSLVQTHPNVEATISAVAAQLPLLDLLMQPGK